MRAGANRADGTGINPREGGKGGSALATRLRRWAVIVDSEVFASEAIQSGWLVGKRPRGTGDLSGAGVSRGARNESVEGTHVRTYVHTYS